MKLLLAIIVFVAALSLRAQTVATTANVLHPIMKDPSKRNAPTSLDRDPGEKASFQSAAPGARPSPLPSAQYAVPTRPVEIIAKVDAGFATSTISLIGTISGIKGRLYVTNIGSQVATPVAQFAVCDQKGFKVASTSKAGLPLAPNESEKIEVVATNANATDLKLMKLSDGSEKK